MYIYYCVTWLLVVTSLLHSHLYTLTFALLLDPSVVPGVFGSQLAYCIDVIRQVMVQALKCPHEEVRAATEEVEYRGVLLFCSPYNILQKLSLCMRRCIRRRSKLCLPLLSISTIPTSGIDLSISYLFFWQ